MAETSAQPKAARGAAAAPGGRGEGGDGGGDGARGGGPAAARAAPAAPAVMTVKPPIRASSTTSASHWDSSDESLERSPRLTSGAVVIVGAGGAAGEIDG